MIKASEFCNKIFDGTHTTPKPTEKGYKLITSKHIKDNFLDKKSAYYISKKDYEEINKKNKVKKWDILFSMIGTIGNVYLIEDDTLDFSIKNIGVFSCDDEYKAKWLYLYLQSPYAKKIITNYLKGAVQKFFPLDALRNLPVPIMNSDKNKFIDFIWNINHKIQLNNKINVELEAMAKTIYDYWFLQFEFPNEEGKPYKSSGGKMVWNEELKREIPEGWEVKNILDVCDVIDCLHSKKPDYYKENEKYYLLTLENLTPNGYIDLSQKYYISEKDYNRWTSRITIKENDFVVTNAGRTGDIGKIPHGMECAIGRNLTAIRPKGVNPYYLRQFFKSNYLKEQVLSNLDCGSFFMSFNVKSIKALKILVPNSKIKKKSIDILKPTIIKIENNVSENRKLTSLRDFLLPLLMNGQVGFKD